MQDFGCRATDHEQCRGLRFPGVFRVDRSGLAALFAAAINSEAKQFGGKEPSIASRIMIPVQRPYPATADKPVPDRRRIPASRVE